MAKKAGYRDVTSPVIRVTTAKYGFGGILQPINSDNSSIFKLGSTIPVKFQLEDINNIFISTAKATLSYAKVSDEVDGTYEESVSTSEAAEGNLFRYDVISNKYIFNLNTKIGFTQGTYKLTIHLDDNQNYSVEVMIK